jgi:hypothetical protein
MPFSDFGACSCQVRFTSMNGHRQAASAGPKVTIAETTLRPFEIYLVFPVSRHGLTKRETAIEEP